MSDDPLHAVFDRLPPAQRDVLALMAMNEERGHPPQLLKALLAKGLLEELKEVRQDRFGSFTLTRYQLPLPVHAAWCAWCAAHPVEGDTP